MQNLKKIIQASGLKATPQRIAILNAMKTLGHASADMVSSELSKIFPSLTVATVYNVLESFVDRGLLAKRFSSNNKMYFDINTYNHAHLYEETTNSYKDYDDPELIELVNNYFAEKNIPGFNLKNVEIQLVGCAAK